MFMRNLDISVYGYYKNVAVNTLILATKSHVEVAAGYGKEILGNSQCKVHIPRTVLNHSPMLL